jgi:[lysine-biosynthesis-protein LysW]--L-2-aminoadipate ligase
VAIPTTSRTRRRAAGGERSPHGGIRVVGSAANQTNVELVRQWRLRGLDAALVAPARLRLGDVALGRLDVLPTLDGVEPGLLALLRLERAGGQVLNGAFALVRTHDKLVTARRLAAAGVPAPRSVPIRRNGEVLLEPPLVLKPRFGSWGRDVFLCRDPGELRETLLRIRTRPWYLRHGALLQELVPPRGRDLRLVVAGGEVVGAGERIARAGEWRTNVSLGASLRAAAPVPEARSLAVAAAAAVGADLVGVDLMPAAGGWVVLELNGAADFDARYSRPGGDVYLDAAVALGVLPAAAALARSTGT